MKRSLIVLCAVALLGTLPLARVADAARPAKVEIWHVTRVIDVGDGLGIGVGRVIEVPENAVPAKTQETSRAVNTIRIGFFILYSVLIGNLWFKPVTKSIRKLELPVKNKQRDNACGHAG